MLPQAVSPIRARVAAAVKLVRVEVVFMKAPKKIAEVVGLKGSLS
jgi:hypothetical protein